MDAETRNRKPKKYKIKAISKRISEEYKKHSELIGWEDITAAKIYHELEDNLKY